MVNYTILGVDKTYTAVMSNTLSFQLRAQSCGLIFIGWDSADGYSGVYYFHAKTKTITFLHGKEYPGNLWTLSIDNNYVLTITVGAITASVRVLSSTK